MIARGHAGIASKIQRRKHMSHEQLSIRTRDGDCPVHVFKPEGPGRWPAAIFYMDGLGIRPTLFQMGQRLADGGYVVLLPDLFYRAGPYAPLEPKKIFASGNLMGAIGHLFSTTNNRRAAEDTEAFLAYLDTRDDIVGSKIGTTGYCMGGGVSLTVAGTYPDRIAVAASFHGGNLATDSELSPHRLASKMQGRIYVAGADQDKSYPPEMAERLEKALSDAGVDHRCEIYPGALHGWTMADFPVYDEPAAERHWRALLALFSERLR
jgi:carboxymethylenebutenolidase